MLLHWSRCCGSSPGVVAVGPYVMVLGVVAVSIVLRLTSSCYRSSSGGVITVIFVLLQ